MTKWLVPLAGAIALGVTSGASAQTTYWCEKGGKSSARLGDCMPEGAAVFFAPPVTAGSGPTPTVLGDQPGGTTAPGMAPGTVYLQPPSTTPAMPRQTQGSTNQGGASTGPRGPK
jgi:hypothetical protein